jgi:hypothetical protein
MSEQSVEDQAREILYSMGVDWPFSSGEIVPLANLINEIERLHALVRFLTVP